MMQVTEDNDGENSNAVKCLTLLTAALRQVVCVCCCCFFAMVIGPWHEVIYACLLLQALISTVALLYSPDD